MANRVEITDEMVLRGVKYYYGDYQKTKVVDISNHDTIRKILEAALNAPEEPEIPVTRAMHEAGMNTLHLHNWIDGSPNLFTIYRAMHRVALEEQKAKEPQPFAAVTGYPEGSFSSSQQATSTPGIKHVRSDEMGRFAMGGFMHGHKRSTDK